MQELIDSGYKEVTLLGQNVNSYGNDFTDRDYRFKELLNDLHKMDIPRVRFTTSHPKDFDEDTVKILAKGGNLMPYIHLPVQSGNNEVLKRMNRKYTKESYMQLVNWIYKYIPNASLTTDIIVGFPGETEEQFQDTLELVKECKFEGAFTFIYSKREGTPAAKYEDNTPHTEKKDRLNRLMDLVNEGYLRGTKRFEGQVVKVLVDGPSKSNEDVMAGYTENNKLVNFTGGKELVGEIVNVKITEAKTWFMIGEKLSKLSELITLLKSDEEIIRFQELEKIIDQNKSIRDDFTLLLDLQKDMVQKEFKNASTLPLAKEKYEKQRTKIMSYPLMEEYLDLLETINNDLQLIKSIIEQEISSKLD